PRLTASAMKKKIKQFRAEYGATPVELAMTRPVKALKAAGELTQKAAQEDEALSILWVLIVALLILYILGLVMDGFGLGELIHILGVVVVVLLVLWLLKLI